MILIDTSVWIGMLRGPRGRFDDDLSRIVGGDEIVVFPFVISEVLQGARSDTDWNNIATRFELFRVLPLTPTLWVSAARINFELRRQGNEVRSLIDCLIAQQCLDHDCELLHNDRDFEKIATVRPLRHRRVALS